MLNGRTRVFPTPIRQFFNFPFIRLLLPSLTVVIVSFIFWQGFQATDDLYYSTHALSLMKGSHTPIMDHRFGRIGMIIPLVILFHFFGVNEFSLTVLPLVCTVITAYLVILLGKHFFDNRTGYLAGLLFAFFPLTTCLSTKFIPEPILSFELCLSMLLFLKSMGNDEKHPYRLNYIAGFIIGISYLTTEVGALMIPIIFIYQFITRKVSNKTFFLILGFITVVILESLYYYTYYGDTFYRFNVLPAEYIQDPMLHSANIDLAYRLFKSYPRYFILPNTDFSLFGPIMIIGGIYGIFNFRKNVLLITWAMVILIFYNFMSIRFDKYVVLPVATRLLLPGCIPLLILSSKSIIEIIRYMEKLKFYQIFEIPVNIIKYALFVLLASISLMVIYINNNTSFTSILARNSEGVAGYLSDNTSVNIISDSHTGNSISFYRQFREADRIYNFERGIKERYHMKKIPTYLVINGVIINEREITGSYYGGDLSIPVNTMDLLAYYNIKNMKPVYVGRYEKSSYFKSILKCLIILKLIRINDLNSMYKIFINKSSLINIMVYSY